VFKEFLSVFYLFRCFETLKMICLTIPCDRERW